MKINLLLLVGLLFTAGCPAAAQHEFPKARVTVRVIDEVGRPLEGVRIRLIFGAKHDAKSIVPVEGVTSNDGLFSGEGHSDGGYGTRIEKEGYYSSGLGAPKLVDIQDGRWVPWDPVVTTVLRRIGQPVALCAKRVQADVPLLNRPCGYDLEKGDWVAPHGSGVISDLIFLVTKDYTDRFNFKTEASVVFSNSQDGLVRMRAPEYAKYSSFRWERSAPEAGYQATHSIRFVNYHPSSGKRPERTFSTENENEEGYFLRLRSVEKNGIIIMANYGKITGDIIIEPRDSKSCLVLFTYYYNPVANDRNLEWNPQKNLLTGLPTRESPRGP